MIKLTLVAGVAMSAGSVLFTPSATPARHTVGAVDAGITDDCKYYHYYVKTGDGFVCYGQGPFCILCPAQT